MTSAARKINVLIIDLQDDWRNLAVRALEEAGYHARALANYDYPPENGHHRQRKPDLVILGCTEIGPEEQALMRRVLESRYRLLILSTSLPPTVMRALFLKGADDVADKPYKAERLVDIVSEVLETITPRDSYQAIEREGAS
jgi:DNA-binding NtrC family response regulator